MSAIEDSPEPVSAKEIARLKSEIHTALHQAQAKSIATGKPLLILAGEVHGSPSSKFLESLIYSEARTIGIKDLSVEFPGYYDTAPSYPMSDSEFDRLNKFQAKFFKHEIHYVDDLYDLATEANHQLIEPRSANIAQNLGAIQSPNLMITGASHLHGIANNADLNKTHTLVIFNTSPDYDLDIIVGLKSIEKKNNYHAFKLHGDPREMDLKSIITTTMSPDESASFMAFLNDSKMIESPEYEKNTLKIFSLTEAMKSEEPYHVDMISNAAYNLKEYDLAARTAALEQKLCYSMPFEKAEKASCSDHEFKQEQRNSTFRTLVAQYTFKVNKPANSPTKTTREEKAIGEMVSVAEHELSQLIAPAAQQPVAADSKTPTPR